MLTHSEFADHNLSSAMGIGLFKAGHPDAAMYMSFAEEDLEQEDSPRARVNALSNAKRALHLQIETLTDSLGFSRWKEKGAQRFPDRARFLEACGLASPRILAKINRLRNDVEHQYVVPERSIVEDYVEVVDLYIAASDKHVGAFPHMREMYTGKWGNGHQMYSLCTQRGSGTLLLYECDYLALIRAWPESDDPPDFRIPEGIDPVLRVDIADPEAQYFEWARLLLKT